VAGGAAAGIASAYNAPLSGALFVSEIVLGTIAMASLGPLLLSSPVATVVTRQVFGEDPPFQVREFQLVSNLELAPYLVLGAALGALAPFFVRLLGRSSRAFAET